MNLTLDEAIGIFTFVAEDNERIEKRMEQLSKAVAVAEARKKELEEDVKKQSL